MAFMSTVSPMPSSTPSYAGASLFRHKYTQGSSSFGERMITERKKLLSISMIFNLKFKTNLTEFWFFSSVFIDNQNGAFWTQVLHFDPPSPHPPNLSMNKGSHSYLKNPREHIAPVLWIHLMIFLNWNCTMDLPCFEFVNSQNWWYKDKKAKQPIQCLTKTALMFRIAGWLFPGNSPPTLATSTERANSKQFNPDVLQHR